MLPRLETLKPSNNTWLMVRTVLNFEDYYFTHNPLDS